MVRTEDLGREELRTFTTAIGGGKKSFEKNSDGTEGGERGGGCGRKKHRDMGTIDFKARNEKGLGGSRRDKKQGRLGHTVQSRDQMI